MKSSAHHTLSSKQHKEAEQAKRKYTKPKATMPTPLLKP
jgi:hypothetical protein